jgi:hypothetical protein
LYAQETWLVRPWLPKLEKLVCKAIATGNVREAYVCFELPSETHRAPSFDVLRKLQGWCKEVKKRSPWLTWATVENHKGQEETLETRTLTPHNFTMMNRALDMIIKLDLRR